MGETGDEPFFPNIEMVYTTLQKEITPDTSFFPREINVIYDLKKTKMKKDGKYVREETAHAGNHFLREYNQSLQEWVRTNNPRVSSDWCVYGSIRPQSITLLNTSVPLQEVGDEVKPMVTWVPSVGRWRVK
jgi:hypothetical protein